MNYTILIGIVLIAVFFRFWQLGTLPGGLFPDEAANGLDVNAIFDGQIQPFYERGNGREALFFYFLAAAVKMFGRTPLAHHLVSALFGLTALIATYFLAKELFNGRIALLSGFFMAVSSYATTISRTAFRANTVPLFATLTIFFAVKFFKAGSSKEKYVYAALTGLCLGLGFYTYISFRMMVPLFLFFGLVLLLSQKNQIRELIKSYWRPKLTFLAGFLVSFSWIGYYFLTHPGTFVGRAGQVSIFSPDLNQGDLFGTFLAVLKKTILSFFTEGDLNWRHNVSGFPFLSPFLSPFFALALVIFTAAIFKLINQAWHKSLDRQTVYQALCASWFWLMLIPEVTTAEGIPHGLRLIGVIPVIFILSAWGLIWVWDKFAPYLKFKTIFAAIFLLGLFAYNFNLYFALAARSPDYYYSFRSDLTEVSRYLLNRNLKYKTYLVLDKFSVQTVDYLTSEKHQPYILLVPENTYQVILKSGDQVVFTQSTLFDRLKFTQTHPSAKLVKEAKNQFRQLIMLVYQEP